MFKLEILHNFILINLGTESEKGDKGSFESSGEIGFKGIKGDNGINGEKGLFGVDGLKGNDGIETQSFWN